MSDEPRAKGGDDGASVAAGREARVQLLGQYVVSASSARRRPPPSLARAHPRHVGAGGEQPGRSRRQRRLRLREVNGLRELGRHLRSPKQRAGLQHIRSGPSIPSRRYSHRTAQNQSSRGEPNAVHHLAGRGRPRTRPAGGSGTTMAPTQARRPPPRVASRDPCLLACSIRICIARGAPSRQGPSQGRR